MNPLIQLKQTAPLFIVALALFCFALSGTAIAAPTNVNLGAQTLQNNTTGTDDTALG